jgi:rare lipoprotein A
MTARWRTLRLVLFCLLVAVLTACSSTGSRRGGGYYQDDGPDANPPSNLDAVPDAVPKIEPFASGANKPYTTLGKSYTPDTSGAPYRQRGLASWYGKKFHGHQTSIGDRYDMYGMTAAHKTLPIPSYVRVTRVSNGKTVVLRVNDRGPFHEDRIIDLSYVAAYKLGLLSPGSAEVLVERITPDQIRNWDRSQPNNAVADAQPVAPPPAAAPMPPSRTSESWQSTSQDSAQSGSQRPSSSLLQGRPLDPVAPGNTAPPNQASSQPNPSSGASPSTSGPNSSSTKALPAGSMFLQAGAFSDQAKAQALADKLSGQITSGLGHPVFVEQTPSNLYRVRIGPFASRADANAAIAPIQSATGLTTSLTAP